MRDRYLDSPECREGFRDLTRRMVGLAIAEAREFPDMTLDEQALEVEQHLARHLRATIPPLGLDAYDAEAMVSDCQAVLYECLTAWKASEGG